MVPPRKAGLGRGLSALIPSPGSEHHLEDVPVGSIRPNPNQPRAVFDDHAMVILTDSIRNVGVLQPVLVRSTGAAGFELIAGERRWRAAQRAGLATIPAIVRNVEDAPALEHALIENLHREDLNPLEEAAAFHQLIDDFGLTHEEVGQRVGKSRSAISNALRLLGLPGSVQAKLITGALSAGHARALLGLDSTEEQERLAEQAERENWSVRATEEAVTRYVTGGTRRREARERAVSAPPAGVLEVETALSDWLDTRVAVQSRGGKGRIVIDFASLDDLDRIWRAMVPLERRPH